MKTKQEILKEIESLKTPEIEFMVYNFLADSFLKNIERYTNIEDYLKAKKDNKISKALLPEQYYYSYNLDKGRLESVTYYLRHGYDAIEVEGGKIKSYCRAKIYYSGGGCCGGGASLNDAQSFENQIRSVEYDIETLEVKSIYNRLLEGKWIKTDVKTNEVVQVSNEMGVCNMPDDIKEILPDPFKCSCASESGGEPSFLIAEFLESKEGRIVKFIVVG